MSKVFTTTPRGRLGINQFNGGISTIRKIGRPFAIAVEKRDQESRSMQEPKRAVDNGRFYARDVKVV